MDVFFNTVGTRDRFLEIEREYAPGADGHPAPARRPAEGGTPGTGPLHVHVCPLSGGFTVPARRWMAVTESDLYGFRKALPGRYELHGRRPGPARAPALRVAEWTDLQPGELVVHVDHGIGKYLGLYEIEFQGRQQEVLAIEYAEKARLYVPVSQAHVLSRYVGLGRHRPEVHALGGRRWEREKSAAATATRDLAGQLLETQAARATLPGHAYAPDTPWQHEFEAAFPFQETPDQLAAIMAVKRDMESARPMDRLICGDVGYGKTEVAMRAAFKAVMDGRQVAMLVPTTILAQQHFETFAERFAAYPFSIEMLSRFRSRAQQAEVVRRLRAGGVDIVIGTHRLVQPDVAFKDLGLVIIDEEQRFGVAHKEQIKQLRQLVDVLTLTATPIPRTLYFSLTGARDLSTIQTPPRDRLPVETIVAPLSDELVRAAILREINRGGQVFYLHNRVRTIEHVRQSLRALVPEARIEAAHGQMPEGQLAGLMRRFVHGEFDVLLCTTIIESGMDIPAVNTILIEHADRFGLADLYQLRGRVGRYKHQAYAYLLLPRHGRLFDTARQRIGAIKQFGSLGAGFKLALRDLEIRGAGNLLGAEQSGHIVAVGFDLYCQLLKRSVAALKGEKPALLVEVETRLDFLDLSTAGAAGAGAAVLPHAYIEDENLRVRAYGDIAAASSAGDLNRLRASLRDRFGPLPPAAERLLKVAGLRILAAARGLQFIEVIGDKVMLRRGADWLQVDSRFPRLSSATPAAKLDELLRLVRGWK
ncbi:MAG: transcription-repair coupling factor [Kiritimatiellaeota bacterium]|nr:transcription-repair coupling factor [Kiritimatiellota bacterium]